ncbi:MAG: electron transfer flavoprotein subunit alpha/FixB family protein [Acidobacteriia bacterium]|nr:electron transfer flavoprotein subunit alpha/FixB family protein [Terriglobia bacterium]
MGKDIWVVAEHFQGHLNDITLELVAKGRELAQAAEAKLAVVLLGSKVKGLASELAADVVYLVDRPEFREFTPEAYCAALEAALKDAQPRAVLMGSTSVGLDLLSMLSARIACPCLDNCTRLEVRDGRLFATSQIYGGKLFVEVAVPEATTLIAVIPGSFPRPEASAAGRPEVQDIPLPATLPELRIKFRKLIEPPPGDVDITQVPVLVAVGRGIQNPDNLPMAEKLAEVLGGAVCASRPVIDQGWLPLTRQVGKSGMTVKPKLYLAFGISGAPEHWEGMKNSELIVAVNTDPKAPIFGGAHYGAVTDALELIPLLTEEARKASMKKAS